MERRALVHCCFRPHPSTMALNDPLHDRQAHAGTLELIVTVQALKHSKQPVRILRIESSAVVSNDVFVFLRAPLGGRLRSHADSLWLRELERVGQKIHQHLPQQ